MDVLSLPGDLDPFQALCALVNRPYPALLDSGCDPDRLGRRSFLATDPFLVVHMKGTRARLRWPREGREGSWTGNPFDLLRELLAEHRAPEPGTFPMAPGGAIGYLAYDLFPHIEAVTPSTLDDLGMPDLFLAFYDVVAVFDRRTGEARLAVADVGGPGAERRGIVRRWLGLARARKPPPLPPPPPVDPGLLESNFTRAGYCRAVERAKEYIAAGHIYQANLSQRFSVPYPGDALVFYDRLRRASPAPFGACLFPDSFAVLSNSPERYLRIDGDRIETRPIKGTRPRGRTPEEDRALLEELRASIKDRAEHVMIVDLERNDLGRVCAYRSVRVPELLKVESYANVHHLVSTVSGRVHPSRDAVDCIRNSFPGGSITGAPKVRAMEIIDELEPTSRGVYCGSVGYIDFSGRVDLNIAIRTAVLADDRLHFQVGGGIVADSDPAEEYEETITKAQSFLKAVTGRGRVWNGRASAS